MATLLRLYHGLHSDHDYVIADGTHPCTYSCDHAAVITIAPKYDSPQCRDLRVTIVVMNVKAPFSFRFHSSCHYLSAQLGVVVAAFH